MSEHPGECNLALPLAIFARGSVSVLRCWGSTTSGHRSSPSAHSSETKTCSESQNPPQCLRYLCSCASCALLCCTLLSDERCTIISLTIPSVGSRIQLRQAAIMARESSALALEHMLTDRSLRQDCAFCCPVSLRVFVLRKPCFPFPFPCTCPITHLAHATLYLYGRRDSSCASSCATKASSTANISSVRPPENLDVNRYQSAL